MIVFARCLRERTMLRLYPWVKSTMPVTDGFIGFEDERDRALAEFANLNNALRKLIAIWEFERENIGRGIRGIVGAEVPGDRGAARSRDDDARGGLGANVADANANGVDPELDPPRA